MSSLDSIRALLTNRDTKERLSGVAQLEKHLQKAIVVDVSALMIIILFALEFNPSSHAAPTRRFPLTAPTIAFRPNRNSFIS